MMRPLFFLLTGLLSLALSSCALITTPIKVAGKVATTSVGLAGKAAGAGFDAITPNSKDEEPEE